jgi:hypothetical protein
MLKLLFDWFRPMIARVDLMATKPLPEHFWCNGSYSREEKYTLVIQQAKKYGKMTERNS